MTEDEKKARKEYYKKWRQNNPEKVKSARERFWQKKINSKGE